jgi:hypothetical protein
MTAAAGVPLCAVEPWTPQRLGTADVALRYADVPLALDAAASLSTAATTAAVTNVSFKPSLDLEGHWEQQPPRGYTGNAIARVGTP